ncbi:piggyBac transposable element-derived protein 3-like [Eupeodes corollae]|uniref:piggyBac transposable element-derived protein 3-like n=1 Tax=Eupeodes corollae TaxID=290404 RepID=UPI00249052FB|nr:piggyBac transposable element-derived protein 3-like [Eupeodes corollae]
MYRQRFLSAKELEDLLMNPSSDEDDELNQKVDKAIETNVIILPPKIDALSDHEEIDDNVQLLEDVNILPNELAENASTSQNIASTSKKESTSFQYKLPKWSKSHRVGFSNTPKDVSSEKIQAIYNKIGSFNPLQIFELFLDNEIINFIVESTNTYANADRNNLTFKTNFNEIRTFIGIMYFSGLHTVPQLDLYWSNQPVFRCNIINEAMSRDRFKLIKSFLHACDNSTIDPSDKFAKVSTLNNMVNKNFMQFGVFSHHLSIDEQMIPYYGRHSAKMFIRGKPIRFGYKYWDLCSHDGYLYQFIPYGGASADNSPGFGLGENVVLRLLSNIDVPDQHTVTFDNFFTSHKLIYRLSVLGYFATGTVRENRTGKAKLTEPKQMKKQNRGTMDFAFDKENGIAAVRWNDNSIVTVLSNHLMDQPITQAKRNYRIRIREKKWYWPLLSNALDAALVNAWKIHGICKKFAKETPMSQLEFRTYVVDSLLRSSNIPPTLQREGNPNEMISLSSDINRQHMKFQASSSPGTSSRRKWVNIKSCIRGVMVCA